MSSVSPVRFPNGASVVASLIRLITDIERIDYVKASIKAVRSAIPDGAIEVERKSARDGSQLSLVA